LKIKKYIKSLHTTNKTTSELEQNRYKRVLYELSSIADVIGSLPDTDLNFRKLRFNQIKDSIHRMNQFLAEPFSFFPDVNLWLLMDKEPVGVTTVRTNDIIWSKNEYEKGFICNKLIYTDIKVF
jgi:hypothetical protein